MEVLSNVIQNEVPLGMYIFMGMLGIAFVIIGMVWLYDIIIKKEKFSFASIGFLIVGVMISLANILSFMNPIKYEQQKVIVSDWNIVYEQGWEVVSRDGKIVVLKRKIDNE